MRQYHSAVANVRLRDSSREAESLDVQAAKKIDALRIDDLSEFIDHNENSIRNADLYNDFQRAVVDGDDTAQAKLKRAAQSSVWERANLANYLLAEIYQRTYDTDKSIKYAKSALAAIPLKEIGLEAAHSRHLAWQAISSAYGMELDAVMLLQSAQRQLEYGGAAKVDPVADKILYNVVQVLAFHEDFTSASYVQSAYEDIAVRTGQTTPYVTHSRARLLSAMGEHKKAIEAFSEVRKLTEGGFNDIVTLQLAKEYSAIGQAEEARRLMADVKSESTNLASKLLREEAMFRTLQAEGDFEAALDHQSTWANAEIRRLKRRLASASRVAKQAMALDSEVLEARAAEAAALYRTAEVERQAARDAARRNMAIAILTGLLLFVSVIALIRNYQHLLREKKDKARIEDLTYQAQAAARAKQRFVSIMSHEFRTPLNHILPVLDSYLRHTTGDPKGRGLARVMDDASHRIVRLFDEITLIAGGADVVDFYPAEFKPADVIEALKLEQETGHILAKDVELWQSIAGNTPKHVATDGAKLTRIALSLVENSMKFGEGEPVHLHFAYDPTPNAEAKVFKGSGTLIMEVRDESGGIDPKILDEVIQPFTQADMSMTRAHDGMGLGLAIVGVLCRAMGGSFKIDAEHLENGRPGTRVIVRVPAYATDGSGSWQHHADSEIARLRRESRQIDMSVSRAA